MQCFRAAPLCLRLHTITTSPPEFPCGKLFVDRAVYSQAAATKNHFLQASALNAKHRRAGLSGRVAWVYPSCGAPHAMFGNETPSFPRRVRGRPSALHSMTIGHALLQILLLSPDVATRSRQAISHLKCTQYVALH
ncbi:hypothetical protein [Paraburkholderia xenovorans]